MGLWQWTDLSRKKTGNNFLTTGFVTVKLTTTDDRGATNTKQATLYVRDTSISGVTILWDKTFETSSSLRSISPAVGDNGDVYVSSNALHLLLIRRLESKNGCLI